MATHDDVGEDRELSLLRRSSIALREMRAKLEALERASREPIAIIGVGCRFPGEVGDNETFWQLLHRGVDAIREVPANRWDVDRLYDPDPNTAGRMYCRRGGFLSDIESWDPAFFRISPREAVSMDPQQRLLLEVAWEALEDAGQAADKLAGSRTGVFLGICSHEYAAYTLFGRSPERIDAYAVTGMSGSVAAGRLSYVLGLQGPALAVDTACSSSLVAVHLAVRSLRGGECRLALAGGVNVITTPEPSISFCRMRALSADGRCKTFDASADGYGRGEGCGLVVLKRLSDAEKDGDRILAVLRGSAVNHDGRSGGLTVPNGPAQVDVIRQALADARLSPADVDCIEAHGTGTPLGDPIEVHALAEVFGPERDSARPLMLGSVKPNIGHLESAAGVAGLIKVVLSLVHEEMPPHLHFTRWNPHIALDGVPFVIPTQPTPWPRGERRRIAGISSFGFGGTNAHLIVEEAPPDAHPFRISSGGQAERMPWLLPLSAKTEGALRELADRYRRFLSRPDAPPLADVAFTAGTGRCHFNHRLAIVGRTAEEIAGLLAGFARGEHPPKARTGEMPVLHWGIAVGPNPPPCRPGDLGELALQYVRGANIPWQSLHASPPPRKAALPTYPFQRRRYWVERASVAATPPASALPGGAADPRQAGGYVELTDRYRALLDAVRERVVRVLDLDASAEIDLNWPFEGLGLDSLMAVELHKSLVELIGAELPETLLFDYPTVAAVTDYLAPLFR